jgi:NAD(P)-dependent dehydrogenase (short-subunit alcohol dehydrogenase family)
MKRLENKVVIVTGGNSGIGEATAELFCREGAKVIISGRRSEENQRVVTAITKKGGEIFAVDADLSIASECEKVIAETIKKYDRIDVLVNNAGIADKHMPITECTEEWYDTVCKVDQYSVYYMTKYALTHMEKQGVGSIVNISSIGSQGVAGIAYSAAKSAVNAMTKNILITIEPQPVSTTVRASLAF